MAHCSFDTKQQINSDLMMMETKRTKKTGAEGVQAVLLEATLLMKKTAQRLLLKKRTWLGQAETKRIQHCRSVQQWSCLWKPHKLFM